MIEIDIGGDHAKSKTANDQDRSQRREPTTTALDWSDRMGRDARRHRRHFRAAHEGFGHSVPKVGRRDSGRNRWRPDVGCFVARGELHLGDGGWAEFRYRLIRRGPSVKKYFRITLAF